MSSPSVSAARVRAGLAKDFANIFRINAQRRAEGESFGQTCGVDVHDHVDQRFHLGGFTRLANEPNMRGKLFEDRRPLEYFRFHRTQ